jgi:hypothetical protein
MGLFLGVWALLAINMCIVYDIERRVEKNSTDDKNHSFSPPQKPINKVK